MINKTTAIATIALSGLLFSACHNREKKPQMGPTKLPVVEVITEDVPIRMSFVGQLYGKKDITIPARVNGFLRGIHFKEGSFVRKGDLLYVIEPAPYEAQTAQSQAEVSRAQAQLVQAQQNYDMIKPLAAINAASQSDLDNAVAQLEAAKAALKAAQSSLTYTEIEQSYTRVTSPVNGMIGRTQAQVGDYVGTGSQSSVLNTVSQVDTMRVLFYIPDPVYTDLIRQGGLNLSDLTLTMAGNIEYPVKGRFDFLGRAVEQSSGALDIQASFANPDTLLRPGQFARITAVVDTLSAARLIPQKAVNQTQGVYNVFTLTKDNKVQSKTITVGKTYNDQWVVTSGLETGERVITDGFHKLREGMTVEPLTNAESGKKAE